MKFDWTQGALAEGLRLYQEGEFFRAHEAWESVWLESQEPEKMFLQGLIQVTAASLVAENRVLSNPASPGSITTSGNKEDFVKIGRAHV